MQHNLIFLGRLRNGENNNSDVKLVHENCSRMKMGVFKWNHIGFKDINTTHLYTINWQVYACNTQCITSLEKTITLIKARNTGNGNLFSANMTWNLDNALFLYVGMKVMITSTVSMYKDLCNSTTSIVWDIVYKRGMILTFLPEFVWVNFGTAYTGATFSPEDDNRKWWVLVHPTTAIWLTPKNNVRGFDEHTRTMLPLKLCCACTIWKDQGQTIRGKVIVHLSNQEKEHYLTYTAFSRVRRFCDNDLFGGITTQRFTSKHQNQAQMSKRINEENLIFWQKVLSKDTKN